MTDRTEVSDSTATPKLTYYVDEAGDGVLFGPQGRNRLHDKDARRFFILGMVTMADERQVEDRLAELREHLLNHPLYATIPSLRPEAGKTSRFFHAKDDHPEVRAKVFEVLLAQDFKFYAVIKDMRVVLDYVQRRNLMHAEYRYHPNELYDLTVRMLFKNRLHQHDKVHVTFARRGKSDRTASLRRELEATRAKFLKTWGIEHKSEITIEPAHAWEAAGLQVADYGIRPLPHQEEPAAGPRANKKPEDIGRVGFEPRNTRHEADFCPPVRASLRSIPIQIKDSVSVGPFGSSKVRPWGHPRPCLSARREKLK